MGNQKTLFTSQAFRKLNQPTANGITKAVVKFILLQKHFGFRVNNTGIYDEKAKKYRTSHTLKGISDIHAIVFGVSIWIEVKAGKDRLSKDQIAFGNRVKEAGGEFWVVRSFDEFRELWKNYITKIKTDANGNGRLQTAPTKLEEQQNKNQV